MSAVGREEQGEELPRLQLLSSFKNVFGFAAVVATVSIVVCLGLSPVSVLHSDSSAQQEQGNSQMYHERTKHCGD